MYTHTQFIKLNFNLVKICDGGVPMIKPLLLCTKIDTCKYICKTLKIHTT